jgi:glycosyltransferase involved in cell wall biosynthesis
LTRALNFQTSRSVPANGTRHQNGAAAPAGRGGLCLSVPISNQVSAFSDARRWRFPSDMLDISGMSVLGQLLVEHLRDQGVETRVLRTNPNPPRFLLGIPIARALWRTAKYFLDAMREVPRASRIHHYAASGLHFFAITLPLLLVAKLWGRPVLLNYHSGDADDFLRKHGYLVTLPLQLAERIVVPSTFLQHVFQRHGLPADILPNVAEVEQFPFKLRLGFAPRLIVARNLTPTYDVATILRAFQIVQRGFPNAELSVVGTGSESHALMALAVSLELAGVTFHGVVANGDMPALYAKCDIAINASVWDNFPGMLVEAGLSGLAIVSSDAGGIPDMIQHQRTGLLVPIRDYKAMAAAIIECVENAEQTKQRVRLAREWAEQYSWANVFPVLMRYYGIERPAEDRSRSSTPEISTAFQ